MAGDVSASNIRIGANIQGLLDGLKRGSSAVRSMTFDMNNKLTDAYRRANKEQSVFRGGLMKLGDDLQGIASKMAVMGTLPTLLAAGKAYKDFAELEKLEKGLTRYGESLQTVREIAKLPNIGVFDAAKSLISLKAMKMEGDLAARSIKAIANAITDAGGSAVDLEPALINLRQFKATRHINQVDVRQLAMRVPQTYDALQSAFGTQDTEKLNQEMSKLGAEKWIDKFVTELEKIPKAGGGAATAMEQLSDTIVFFSASIGKGLEEAFGVSQKLHAIGDVLDNLSTNFRNLTPEAQKSIFAVGAIAVVMPAVIGAVGGLIKLLPLLATGFGLITAPIAATIAVVGVAAAAIITQWDSVKSFLIESTWWNTLVGAAKAGLGVITETFKVVINFIQGDWSNMGKALVNILKNTANFALTTIGGLLKGVLGLFGTFNEALGFNALGKGISNVVKSIDPLINKFKFDVPDSVGMAKEAIGGVGKVLGNDTPIKKHTKAIGEATEHYEKMSDAAFKMWQIDLVMKWDQEQQALKEKVKSFKDFYGVVTSLNTELLKGKNISDVYLGKDADAFNKALAKSKANDIFKKKGEDIVPEKDKPFASTAYKNGTSSGSWRDVNPEYIRHTVDQYRDAASALANVNIDIMRSFDDLNMNILGNIGEGLGDMLSGAGDGFKNLGFTIYNSLSNLFTQLGKALLTYGVVIKGLKAAITSMNPVVAAAAGVLALAAGKALKNNVSKMGEGAVTAFADGGFAHRNMIARVGDNRNARFDPEMIAPYSKVDSSIKKSISEAGGGGAVFIPDVRLDGQDLYISFKRTEAINNAIY